MSRTTTVAITLVAILTGVGYVWTKGVTVKTTAETFVTRADMPLFEVKSGKMNVRMAPTPAAWPEQAATIYRAASLGLPIEVELQSKSGNIFFNVAGLSKEGDFLIPCASAKECRSILEAAQLEIPEQLNSLDLTPRF